MKSWEAISAFFFTLVWQIKQILNNNECDWRTHGNQCQINCVNGAWIRTDDVTRLKLYFACAVVRFIWLISNRRIVDFYEWTNAERTGRYTWVVVVERMRKQNAVDFFVRLRCERKRLELPVAPPGTKPVAGIDIGHFETRRARKEH